jgi:hypothetical protein
MARRGRPPKARVLRLREAREFGRLVEIERGRGGQVGTAMEAVRRRSPRRWGSRSKMFALWKQYRADKARRARQASKDRKGSKVKVRTAVKVWTEKISGLTLTMMKVVPAKWNAKARRWEEDRG